MDTAYARSVAGLTLPRSLGGHPALDLCNTRAGWGEADPKEYLATYDHLAVFAGEAGVLSAAAARRLRKAARQDERTAALVLARARALREALYATLDEPSSAAGWAVVAGEARAAAARSELVPGGGAAEWRLVEDERLDLPALAFAGAASQLLTSPQAADVARCPGHGCGWLFLSRSGRRRWCSMAVCGNRSKVRRHAERARAR